MSPRRILGTVAGLVGLVAVVGLVLTLVPSDHYLVLPDRARPADPLVAVPGEDGDAGEDGIYMVDVTIGRASLLERLFPEIREGASLVPAHVINPTGVSDRQRRRASLQAMSRSQLVAITVALRELGHDVDVEPAGAEVVLVQPGTPADGELEVGDVIVAANGEEIETIAGLRQAMAPLEPGDPVELAVERGEDDRLDLTLETEDSSAAPGRAVVGVQVRDAEDFDFPVDVEIDAGSIGGPSAGLAFALEIVNTLGDDVARGRKVVATGELTLGGEVARVGGLKQKTIAARRAGADVFLVPRENADEARAEAGDLEIVPVSTFAEALSLLTTP
ncbi:MAG TPA: S16 family serine protease [Gaiellaceae bacterium]|nr:S16 family serine protease [Gaiellaceae bacterium]